MGHGKCAIGTENDFGFGKWKSDSVLRQNLSQRFGKGYHGKTRPVNFSQRKKINFYIEYDYGVSAMRLA